MKSQGLPVNMIVLTALALLVLVVVGAFFITGMSGAAKTTSEVIDEKQAACSSICNTLVTVGMGFQGDCIDFLTSGINAVNDYTCTGEGCLDCAYEFGRCVVTLRNGDSCYVE